LRHADRSKKVLYVDCDCESFGHAVRIKSDIWQSTSQNGKDWPPDAYLEIAAVLTPSGGIFRRLKAAFQYVFGFHVKDSYPFTEALLEPQQAKELRDFIDAHLADLEKANAEFNAKKGR
jgi:hypothetical protein